MAKAFGIINATGNHIWVEGMQEYRPIGAFSFLGRYRVIDFPMSNFSNSDIDRINVMAANKPRSLVEHLGTGRHYNINSKKGKIQILFADNYSRNNIYSTDIAAFDANSYSMEKMIEPYVVIAPGNMVFKQNFKALLEHHIASGADITLLYHTVGNAHVSYLNCEHLILNRQGGVREIQRNRGGEAQKDIFMGTYVMKKELFLKLVRGAKERSSMYTLAQAVDLSCEELDVRGYAHEGYFAAITDLKSYYDANMSLLDIEKAEELMNETWPIYTRTNDSHPTKYSGDAQVKRAMISNGCAIEGTVENSIIGRGCTIKKGVVVRDSVVLPDTCIEEGIYVEHQVIDKHSRLIHCKELIGTKEQPGYVRRGDTL